MGIKFKSRDSRAGRPPSPNPHIHPSCVPSPMRTPRPKGPPNPRRINECPDTHLKPQINARNRARDTAA
jgi:hypothetical protein